MLRDPWLLLPAALAALASYLATPLVGRMALRYGIVDLPGPRKVHDRPIPRLGGLAIVAAASLGLAVLFALLPPPPQGVPANLVAGLGLGILPILLTSALDDVRGLGPGPRFLGQLVGAAIAVGCGVSVGENVHLFGAEITIGWLAPAISLLWIVGVTNAFNLIDGLDGLSVGSALISAGGLVAVFVVAGQPATALVALVLVGALAGFLPHNLHPARIFMGDVGAEALGFALACLTLKGGATLTAGLATLLPVALLAVPLADTLLSFSRRLVRRMEGGAGNGVFEGDGDHIHHRLLAMGLGHQRAVLLLLGISLACVALALASILMTAREAGLLLIGMLLAGFVGVSRLGYEEFGLIRNGFVLRFYDAPVLRKSLFGVFADLVMVSVAVWAAVALKYEDPWLQAYRPLAFRMTSALAPVTVATMWVFGVYRGTWRLAGVVDFFRLSVAIATSALCGFLAYGIAFEGSAPLALFATYAAVELVMAFGARVSYRVLLSSQMQARRDGVPAVIYGAGQRGSVVLRQLLSDERAGMRAVAFVDDQPGMAGRAINGVPIVGGVDRLREELLRRSARRVVVSTPKISPANLEAASLICEQLGVELLQMTIAFKPLPPPLPAPGPLGSPEHDGPVRAVAFRGASGSPAAAVPHADLPLQ